MRDPSDVSKKEKEQIRKKVHEEAEKIRWHTLNNKQKSVYYDKWAAEFDISRAYLKDRIMKGFDVSQGVPLKGEASIQKEIEELLTRHGISIIGPFMLGGKYKADLVLGFYKNFPTHVVEIERADTWLNGFTQLLGYASDYFMEHQKIIQPVLIIFGSISATKLEKIKYTCDYSRVVVCSYNLTVKGKSEIQILSVKEYFGLESNKSIK